MRDFWRSQREPPCAQFAATRFAPLVRPVPGRPAQALTASVNLITVHDGFTLKDLVSYDH